MSIVKVMHRPIARCRYYEVSVQEIESPDWPFECEFMNNYRECPAHCRYYEVVIGDL